MAASHLNPFVLISSQSSYFKKKTKMGEIIYILLCLIFVLDICCDTTNIYKLPEALHREESQTTIWKIPKYIKSYFLCIAFVLESYRAILSLYSIVWVWFVFLNKWMGFLVVWAFGKVKLLSSSFILKVHFPLCGKQNAFSLCVSPFYCLCKYYIIVLKKKNNHPEAPATSIHTCILLFYSLVHGVSLRCAFWHYLHLLR